MNFDAADIAAATGGTVVAEGPAGPILTDSRALVPGAWFLAPTRALIALAVRELGEVHQTTGNLNNHLGVPMTLLAAPNVATAVVVELGTSSPGEIALLADIARPTVRLVVNVGPAHLLELGGL